ncbi:hypothetical protein K2173_028522 [Erythroxylum novogranatense]|uniref:Uncharacterized protein n=1 Tax=Erythroxylum novogranatense TaxID=1862640 RepID=A0AAV8U4T5_9ROSI|nr:hypothetical protein K2173_028522 [Erythroxylum novogranatense]
MRSFSPGVKGAVSTMMIAFPIQEWRAVRMKEGFTASPSIPLPHLSPIRKEIGTFKTSQVNMSVNNSKQAHLFARKRERVKLPPSDDTYRLSEFLRHPYGIQSVLNTNSFQSFQSLDANTYRCIMPKLQLLNFETVPVLELRVTPTSEDCIVEMLSCQFRYLEPADRKDDDILASLKNHITWNTSDIEQFVEIDLMLSLTLEVDTIPFVLLPISTVEVPGNLLMQTLVDRAVPVFQRQLIQNYNKWARQQHQNIA